MKVRILLAIFFASWSYLGSTRLLAQVDNNPATFSSIEAAVAGLDSDSFEVRRAATEKLANCGVQAVPAVLDAWLDEDSSTEVRMSCQRILDGWTISDNDVMQDQLWRSVMLHPQRRDSPDGRWYGHPHFTPARLDPLIRRYFKGTGVNASVGSCQINREWNESEEEMEFIAVLPELKSLYFSKSVSAERLRQLGRARKLARVTVVGIHSKPDALTAAHIDSLAQVESLTVLSLTNILLEEKAVANLVSLPNLTSLSYELERPGDLQLIANLGNLTSLGLSHNSSNDVHLTASDLQSLTRLELKTLNFGSCRLDEDAIKILHQFPHLDFLRIRYSDLESLEEILRNRRIESLWIRGLGVDSDRVAARLAKADHLRELGMSWTEVTDHGVRSLSTMHFLKKLRLSTSGASRSGIENLRTQLSGTTDVRIDSFTYITAEQSEFLGEFQEKGARIQSLSGNLKFLYIFQESWTGSEADFANALDKLSWTRLVTDLPLTESLVATLERSVTEQGRSISVRENGQHPQYLLDRLQQQGHFLPSEDRFGRRLRFVPEKR